MVENDTNLNPSERRLLAGWRAFCIRYWVVLFVVCVGIVVSWSSYNSFVRAAESQQTRASIHYAQGKHDEIVQRFEEYEHALQYMRGYLLSSQYVDQGEWSGFVKHTDLESSFPGVWGFAYVERVGVGGLPGFIDEMRGQGFGSFSVKTHNGSIVSIEDAAYEDRERYILKYEEPIERNRAVIGLDVTSLAANKAVYDEATDTGMARLSNPFRLAQRSDEKSEFGLVMVMPVYRAGMPLEGVEDRREAVSGWVALSLDMTHLQQNSLSPSDVIDRLTLSIEASNGQAVELFDIRRGVEEDCEDCEEVHEGTTGSFATEVAGKELFSTLVVDSEHGVGSFLNSGFDENMRKANNALALGVRLTLLVIVVTLIIEYGRIRSGRMTNSLRKSERQQRAFAYNAQVANKAKSAFLANMSHEIRSPMTSVLGYTELLSELLEEGGAESEMRHALDRIDRAGSHLLHVVNDVLDVSKIESGKLPIRMVACQIGEVLSEVVGVMRVRASEAGLGLAVDFETEVPARVLADPYRVRQILLNLVGNAIKFTKEGGVRIVVGCEGDETGGELWFAVHDTGVGMQSDRIEALFEPFEQDDSLQDSSNIGTGLGLTISRQLTEMMGGELTASSVLGEGSVFTCKLPVRVPDDDVVDESKAWGGAAMIDCLPCEATIARGQKELISGIGGRVLVAEDGEDNQRLIGHFLLKGGVEAVFVENGQEAIDVIENSAGFEFEFDLIILDIQMPVMDGHEAARTLRARGCTIPILALTANAMSGDRQRCIDAGCDEYETKPVNRARLLRTVARMMGRLEEEAVDGGDGARAA